MNDMPELQETTSTSVVIAVSKNRVYSMDNLDSAPSNGSHRRIAWQGDVSWDRSHALTEKWLEEWKVVA